MTDNQSTPASPNPAPGPWTSGPGFGQAPIYGQQPGPRQVPPTPPDFFGQPEQKSPGGGEAGGGGGGEAGGASRPPQPPPPPGQSRPPRPGQHAPQPPRPMMPAGAQFNPQQGPSGSPPPGAPHPNQPNPQPRSKKPLIIILSLVVAFILLITGIIFTFWYLEKREQERAEAERQATIQSYRTAATERTEEFVTALGDHDAEAALATSLQADVDSPGMTDEVLAATYPDGISDLTTEVPGTVHDFATAISVEVGYTAADTDYQYTLKLVRNGDDWRIEQVSDQILFSDNIEMTLNGVNVGNEAELSVFPGTYTAAPANTFLHAPDAEPVVIDLSMSQPWHGTIDLTEAAITEYRAAGKTSLEECLSKKELAPEGCPWRIREENNIKVDTSTIEYTADGPDWSEVTPFWDGQNAVTSVRFQLDVTATATQNGNRGTTETSVSAGGQLFGDLSGEKVTVKWNER